MLDDNNNIPSDRYQVASAYRSLTQVVVVLPIIAGGLPLANFQDLPQPPSFAVASIKLNPNCNLGQPADSSPGRLHLPCKSLRSLVRMAYGTFAGGTFGTRSVDVLNGPSWLDKEYYEISAKADSDASYSEMAGPMLQTLLEDRFKLRVRRESRESSVYILTLAKGGPKFKLSKEGSCTAIEPSQRALAPGESPPRPCGSGRVNTTDDTMTIDAYSMTLDEFVGRLLPGQVHRPIVDKTGLTGRFDIHLEFTPDIFATGPMQLNGVPSSEVIQPSNNAAGPSIFTALKKQLGLKLSPSKGPVQVLIIDHAERPSPN